MLEFARKSATTRPGQIRLGILASVMFLVFMVVGLLVMAQPYAVYATGEQVEEPWAISVDGEQVALVESEEAAQTVQAGIVMQYTDSFVDQQTAKVQNNVTIAKYNFDAGKDHPVVVSADEAVAEITAATDADGEALVKVQTEQTVTVEEEIAYDTETVKTSKLYKGVTKVKTKGQNGTKEVTKHETLINGKVALSEVLSEKVTKEPVNKVVLKGTKVKKTKKATTSSSSSGSSYSAPSGSSGSAIASYACQFTGNPYVWGGSSLTNGADCSGFTMAVYAKFGISLPHNSYTQGSMGTRVSNPQPGDLVCYGGHVGIYIGGGQMVHASTPSSGIKISSVNYASHWYQRIL